MPQESIFHKLIKNENSYTQLLCNILRRDGGFRNDFFNLVGVQTTSLGAVRIQTQKGLAGHGQADILMQSSSICMIIEVKTEALRSMTDKQLLNTPKSYLRWLEQKVAESKEAWLIYLVPATWSLLDEKTDAIGRYERSVEKAGVRIVLLIWEDVINLLAVAKRQTGFSVIEEFYSLLCERFGPIVFDDMETEVMFSENFPVA